MVFLAGGITHSSFGGLGIAFYLGTDPIAGAMIFAVLSALGIEWAGSRGHIREDSAIGIIWSVGMAVGALFMSLRPGYVGRSLRIPVRQHRHRDTRRRRGADRSDAVHHRRSAAIARPVMYA